MSHSNKQVLLFGIWEKFDIPLPTTMTDHGKAGYFIIATRDIFQRIPSPSDKFLPVLYGNVERGCPEWRQAVF